MSRLYWAASTIVMRKLTGGAGPELARRMTGQPHSLAAILVRLTEREAQITSQADTIRKQIEQLTGHLGELGQQLGHVRITRKTLADLSEPQAPSAPILTHDPPEHPAYEQILAVLATADQPLRAREVTMAINLPTTATDVNNARHKLNRPTSRNLAVETEQGRFAHTRAQSPHTPKRSTGTRTPPLGHRAMFRSLGYRATRACRRAGSVAAARGAPAT